MAAPHFEKVVHAEKKGPWLAEEIHGKWEKPHVRNFVHIFAEPMQKKNVSYKEGHYISQGTHSSMQHKKAYASNESSQTPCMESHIKKGKV